MATAPASIIQFPDRSLADFVDQLGDIKAQIADLKRVEDEIVGILRAKGAGTYEGGLFRAAVSQTADAVSIDPKAMEEKLRELGVDGRWFSRHEKVRAGTLTVRVSARRS